MNYTIIKHKTYLTFILLIAINFIGFSQQDSPYAIPVRDASIKIFKIVERDAINKGKENLRQIINDGTKESAQDRKIRIEREKGKTPKIPKLRKTRGNYQFERKRDNATATITITQVTDNTFVTEDPNNINAKVITEEELLKFDDVPTQGLSGLTISLAYYRAPNADAGSDDVYIIGSNLPSLPSLILNNISQTGDIIRNQPDLPDPNKVIYLTGTTTKNNKENTINNIRYERRGLTDRGQHNLRKTNKNNKTKKIDVNLHAEMSIVTYLYSLRENNNNNFFGEQITIASSRPYCGRCFHWFKNNTGQPNANPYRVDITPTFRTFPSARWYPPVFTTNKDYTGIKSELENFVRPPRDIDYQDNQGVKNENFILELEERHFTGINQNDNDEKRQEKARKNARQDGLYVLLPNDLDAPTNEDVNQIIDQGQLIDPVARNLIAAFNEGTYYMINPFNQQRLINQKANNASGNAEMAVANDASNLQKWQFKQVGENAYTIQNLETKQYLEVPYAACAINQTPQNKKRNVGSYLQANSNHQRWTVTSSGDYYNLKPLHCTSTALDRDFGGPNAHLYEFSETNKNQKWGLQSVTAGKATVAFTKIEAQKIKETIADYFKIHPNPVTGDVINVETNGKRVSYTIFQSSGVKSKEGELRNGKINVNNLKSGLYMVQLRSDSSVDVKKIMVK